MKAPLIKNVKMIRLNSLKKTQRKSDGKRRIFIVRIKTPNRSTHLTIDQIWHQIWNQHKRTKFQQWSQHSDQNYTKLNDHTFMTKVSQLLPGMDTLLPYFQISMHMDYIRRYANTLNRLYCAKYTHDLLEEDHRTAMTIAIILARSKQQSSDNAHFQDQVHQQHTHYVQRQESSQRFINHLNHLLHAISGEVMSTDRLISLKMFILERSMDAMVRYDLEPIRIWCDQKKMIGQYQIDQCRLLDLFYQSKPTVTQIVSAQMIWKTTEEMWHYKHDLIISNRILMAATQQIIHPNDHHQSKSLSMKIPNEYLIPIFTNTEQANEQLQKKIQQCQTMLDHEWKKLRQDTSSTCPIPIIQQRAATLEKIYQQRCFN